MLTSTLLTLIAGGLSAVNAAAIPEKRATYAIDVMTDNLWSKVLCLWNPDQAGIAAYSFVSNAMTPELCTSTCERQGYLYAGLEWGNKCWCGNGYGGNGYPIAESSCQTYACTGKSSVACGGVTAVMIYQRSPAWTSSSAAASSSASASVASSLAASRSVSASLSASVAASVSASNAASVSRSASLAASASVAASLQASVAASSLAASAYQSSLAASIVQSSLAASASAANSLQASISRSASAAASVSAAASLQASIAASASVASSLSASASASAAAAAATNTPAPWVPAAVACVAEGTAGRALTGASTSDPAMTYTKCLSFCASKGFAIAGLEYSSECYCGNSLVNGASLSKPSSQCNMACSGSATKTCGGPDALTIFVTPEKVTGLGSDLTSKVASLPTGWAVASTSCVAEGTTGRALTGGYAAAGDMTITKCLNYCAGQNMPYAGLEYGGECFCGASLVNGASLDKASNQCNMACGGDVNAICGGPGSLSLYTNPSVKAPVTTVPVVNNDNAQLPTGWSAASTACIQEVAGRALTGASTAGDSMTLPKCLAFCQDKGFAYAGVEFGQECYCGSSLANGASLSNPSQQCNMPCAGDSKTLCGGPNAIQLFTNPSMIAAATPKTVVINGFSSSGCIQEVSGRALTGKRVDFADMTIEKCTAACASSGFKYAGVEYGQECYCGNSLANGASTSLTSGQCVMDCPGNNGQKCGGPNAIQLYTLN